MSIGLPIFQEFGDEYIGFLKEGNALVKFGKGLLENSPGTGPTNPTIKPYLAPQDSQIMFWGDGNDFPQSIIELYSKDTVIPTTLGKMASSIIEGGIFACKLIGYNEDGSEIIEPIINDAEINNFINAPWFRMKYLHEMANDMVWFFNGFPEIILSKDRTKIVQLLPNESAYCRWSVNDQNGKSKWLYINANWPMASTEDGYTKKLPVLDPYQYDIEITIRNDSWFKYIYPISYPTPGKKFYQLAHHHSIVTSGWLDVHAAIPDFKKFLLKNQQSIKYQWEVDQAYWSFSYGEKWDKANTDERRKIVTTWLTEMNKKLSDTSKTGNSIVTEKVWDIATKQYKSLISIVDIPDSLKDGKHIIDGQEAAVNILYAIGVDPSTVGFVSAQGGSRSGGSDKREGWLIDKSRLSPFRDFIVEPLYFVSKYNGWQDKYGGNLRFRFRDTILTTLNTGAGTKKVIS